MGRSESPLDSATAQVLAARAAAAAAAAAEAQAAADALNAGTADRLATAADSPFERAAAAAIPETDGGPTLAESDRPDGMDDIVGATTVGAGVAGVAASLGDLGLLVDDASVSSRAGLPGLDDAGSDRADMLGLPGLDGILSGAAGASALAGAAPTAGFSSGGGGIDQSSIRDDDGGFGSDVTLRDAWDHPILTGAKLLVDAVDAAAETFEEAGDWARDAASDTKEVVDAVYEYATDDDSDDASSNGSSSGTEGSGAAPTGTDDGSGANPAGGSAPGISLEVQVAQQKASEGLDLWQQALYEAQQEAEANNASGEGAARDGATDVKYVVQGDDDLSGNPYAGGYAGLLGGVTGHTGSGGMSPLGPSGGGTTTNPGPEGFAPAEKGAIDASAVVAYGGVKDPPKPVEGPAVLDPSKLGVAPEGADPGAVNPGDPNASTAAGAAHDASVTSDVSEGFELPPAADPADAAFGESDEHGRGIGHGQGRGDREHGHGWRGGDSTDAMDDDLG